jgi:hypothetical protein
MDFQKSKALLDKINALYKNISGDPRNVSSIERDLMRSYVQQFYECFLDLANAPAVAPPPPVVVVETKPVEPKITLRRPETAPPPPMLDPQPEPPKPEPPKVGRVPEPAPAPPPPPPVVEKAPVIETPPPPPPVAKPEPAPVAYQAPVGTDPELEELFSFKTATELSEKLSQLPIGDIKKAMGLNERISTQNELFGGDAADFENTVSALNQLRNYEEAKNYLIRDMAVKYNWLAKAKKDKAKEFIKLVRRRY